ncbi:MAG: T9SS type A sorting domain-containing protein [Saprospiraceae bacterium]|nr:T9SS type A sorting domain-containing protein [Saprospiraceae bacterium]
MKLLYTIIISFLFQLNIQAQAIGIEQIVDNGHPDKRINIVILGDGYTATQQQKFINDSKIFSQYLFQQEPFNQYKNYFNVYAIKVVSQDSGARHDNSAPDCPGLGSHPISTAKTYLDTRFDAFGIHRLIVPFNSQNIATSLAKYFPSYDQVIILVNTPYYGGSGGAYATSTLHSSSNEISVHEIGHSFAGLSDEYYAGDQYARESTNMTQTTDSSIVRWKNWLGFRSVGIYQHCCGGNSSKWFKPHQSCKMQALGLPFCNVCKEGIIEVIHRLINPLILFSPKEQNLNVGDTPLKFSLEELIKPIPNSQKISWNYINRNIAKNVDSIFLQARDIPLGNSKLSVFVEDTNLLIRIDNHEKLHFSIVEWNINKTVNSLSVSGKSSLVEWSISPVPAVNYIDISLLSGEMKNCSIHLINQQGQIVHTEKFSFMSKDKNFKLDISNLNSGSYHLQIMNESFNISKPIVIRTSK